MGIEPTSSAWKAEVLPLNYARARKMRLNPKILLLHSSLSYIPNNLFLTFLHLYNPLLSMVEGVGFEPTKAKPADLQSAPVDRLGTPPRT